MESKRKPEHEASMPGTILCRTVPGEIFLSGNAGGEKLMMRAVKTGKDWTVMIAGGAVPHIGCAVLALPRESLRGDGKRSSTASVLNVTGHKDEEICRHVAEKLAVGTGRTVVCTGGIHVDGITPEQIEEIRNVAGEMTERLLEEAEKM